MSGEPLIGWPGSTATPRPGWLGSPALTRRPLTKANGSPVKASFAEFVSFTSDSESAGVYRNIPLIGFVQAGVSGFFDDAGYRTGGAWDEIPFPGLGDPYAYALEVTGDSMEPVFRDGDSIIVSPQANIRRGDRVVVKTKGGEVMVKVLLRQSARKLDLQSLNPNHEDRSLLIEEIDWMARVVWASK